LTVGSINFWDVANRNPFSGKKKDVAIEMEELFQ